MKVNDRYDHFVAIVAGEDPVKNMAPFDMNKKLDAPITIYHFSDAGKLRKDYMNLFRALLNNKSVKGEERENIESELREIEGMSDTEFYYDITQDYEYDPETGDAITTKNSNGKWCTYNPGKLFSIPFKLKNGTTSYSARKGDVDWSLMHLYNTKIYESAWELVMEGRSPETEEEKIIYENMKERKEYFKKFENKENYVLSSTAFWGYSFVDDYGWTELGYEMDQYEWMKNYYDRFIKNLPDDTLLTIYECRRF